VRVDAGVVDQDVDPAQGGDRRLGHGAGLAGIGDVAGDHRVPVARQAGRDRVRPGGVGPAVHGHPVTGPGQRPGDRRTNPA